MPDSFRAGGRIPRKHREPLNRPAPWFQFDEQGRSFNPPHKIADIPNCSIYASPIVAMVALVHDVRPCPGPQSDNVYYIQHLEDF